MVTKRNNVPPFFFNCYFGPIDCKARSIRDKFCQSPSLFQAVIVSRLFQRDHSEDLYGILVAQPPYLFKIHSDVTQTF